MTKIEKERISFNKSYSITAPIISNLIDASIGIPIVSSFIGIVMGYKQKRFEENIVTLISGFKEHVENLEKQLSLYNPQDKRILREDIFPLIFDYSANEIQKEKIKLIINGLVYVIDKKYLNQDRVLELYDTLQALRLSDIDFLLEINDKNKTNKNYFDRRKVDRLHNLGIVNIQPTLHEFNGHSDYSNKSVNISRFGIQFLCFIHREYSNGKI